MTPSRSALVTRTSLVATLALATGCGADSSGSTEGPDSATTSGASTEATSSSTSSTTGDPGSSDATGGETSGSDSSSTDTGDATSSSETGGPCVGDWAPGDYPPEIADVAAWLTIDGVPGQTVPREYKVHVPPDYDCREPTPLLFCLHGLMQNGVMFCVNGTDGASSGPNGMVDKADEQGFLLVIPNGVENAWNGAGCCGNEDLDDVALFRALLEEVSTHLNVDADRVYAAGLSNGGYMGYRLACEAADVFTAVISGSGGMSGFSCSPERPVSLLQTHGTLDQIVPYAQEFPSVAAMAEANGCSATTEPATIPASGGDTTCITHTGCPPGIEVTACTVEGGGHAWFGDPGCGTGAGQIGCNFVGANSDFLNVTDAGWEFLQRLSR